MFEAIRERKRKERLLHIHEYIGVFSLHYEFMGPYLNSHISNFSWLCVSEIADQTLVECSVKHLHLFNLITPSLSFFLNVCRFIYYKTKKVSKECIYQHMQIFFCMYVCICMFSFRFLFFVCLFNCSAVFIVILIFHLLVLLCSFCM